MAHLEPQVGKVQWQRLPLHRRGESISLPRPGAEGAALHPSGLPPPGPSLSCCPKPRLPLTLLARPLP